jgi:hypothetical protein
MYVFVGEVAHNELIKVKYIVFFWDKNMIGLEMF